MGTWYQCGPGTGVVLRRIELGMFCEISISTTAILKPEILTACDPLSEAALYLFIAFRSGVNLSFLEA